MKFIKILFVLLFVSSTFINAQIQPIEFSKAIFIEGLPEQLKKFPWKETIYAEIKAEPFYKNIYLLFKDKTSFPIKANIVLVKNDGGFSIVTKQFEVKNEKYFQTEPIFKTEDGDELTPLVMKIDTSKNFLLYKWSKSKENVPIVTKEYPLKPSKKFPNLRIETEDGEKQITDFRGSIIVINWWATTCSPCIREIPDLNKLVKKYQDKKIIFLSILFDKENFEKFMGKHVFNYLHGFSNDEIFKTLGGSFPRNIIIDKNGVIVHNELGSGGKTGERLDEILQGLL